MSKNLKIGIIQNTPLTADLSNNLRQIVQGYRDCLDHGADLIIAPACALCGADVLDLASRQSFIRQTRAALDNLARELGETPLILGAYSPLFSHDDDFTLLTNEEDQPDLTYSRESRPTSLLTPYLLESNEVTELEEATCFDLDGTNIYIDLDDEIALPEDQEPDLIIHLPSLPWFAGAATTEEEARQWEARNNGTPVICVRHVGASQGNLYSGGSAVYSPSGTTISRLPFFTGANRVVNLATTPRAKALPTEQELLYLAIERGIRDSVRNNGYSGVCLNLDHANAPLLAAICVESLGRSNVLGFSEEKSPHAAAALNISCRCLPTGKLVTDAAELTQESASVLSPRLAAALQFTIAESRGLLYLSPLSRRDFMTGNFSLYGDSAGLLAPLGNLYEMDLHMLRCYIAESHPDLFGPLKEPEQPQTDRIIHELVDRNISAGELLCERVCPFQENDVRLVQRKIIASALKRTQIPLVLHADPATEQPTLPISHRLND